VEVPATKQQTMSGVLREEHAAFTEPPQTEVIDKAALQF
jgi:hypothetical protein